MLARPHVLVQLCYCNPTQDVDCGLGWNAVVDVAAQFELFVITSDRSRNDIEAYLRQNGVIPNLRFFYASFEPTGALERLLDRILGSGRRMARRWQANAAALGRALHVRYRFDLFHHVPFEGIGEAVWAQEMKVPFILGPIYVTARPLLRFHTLPAAVEAHRNFSRSVADWIRLRLNRYVRRGMQSASIVLAGDLEAQRAIRQYYDCQAIVLITSDGGRVQEFADDRSRIVLADIYARALHPGSPKLMPGSKSEARNNDIPLPEKPSTSGSPTAGRILRNVRHSLRRISAIGLAVLWISVIFFSSTGIARRWAEEAFHSLAAVLSQHAGLGGAYDPLHFAAEKSVHIGLFFGLALLLMRILPRRYRNPAVIILTGAVVGSASEFLQRFFPGRDPTLRDVCINIAATALGAFAGLSFLAPKRCAGRSALDARGGRATALVLVHPTSD